MVDHRLLLSQVAGLVFQGRNRKGYDLVDYSFHRVMIEKVTGQLTLCLRQFVNIFFFLVFQGPLA